MIKSAGRLAAELDDAHRAAGDAPAKLAVAEAAVAGLTKEIEDLEAENQRLSIGIEQWQRKATAAAEQVEAAAPRDA
jgi:hypothetical protein